MDTVSDLELQLLPTKTDEVIEYSPAERFKQYIPKAIKHLARDTAAARTVDFSESIWSIVTSESRVVVATTSHSVYLLSDDMTSYRKLGEHNDAINKIIFTNDEKYAITCSRDRSIKIFSLVPPQENPQQYVLNGHTDLVNDIRISTQDGIILYSCSDDNKVNIWDLYTMELIASLEDPDQTGYCRSMDFTSDFKHLVVSAGSNLFLWDLYERKMIAKMEGYTEKISKIKLAPDDKYLASGSDDKSITIWNLDTRSLVTTLTGHTGIINNLLITSDSRYLISSAQGDKTIKLWGIEFKKLEANFQGHDKGVTSMIFSQDQRFLFSTSNDNTIRIWSMEDRNLLSTLTGHTDSVYDSALLKVNSIITGGLDKNLKIWNFRREHSKCLQSEGSNIMSIQTYDYNRHFYTVDTEFNIKHWDKRTTNFEVLNSEKHGTVYSMLFIIEKQELIVGCENKIFIFNIASRNITHELECSGEANCLAITKDNKTLFAGSSNGIIFEYNYYTKKKLHEYEGHDAKISAIRISRDESIFMTTSYDKNIKIWDLRQRTVIKTLDGHTDWVNAGFLIKEDKYVISASDDRSIRIWNIATGLEEARLDGHSHFIRSAALSSDERYLVSGDMASKIIIWDLVLRTQIYILELHSYCVTQLKFTKDNTYILSSDLGQVLMMTDTRDLFMNNSIIKENPDEDISIRGVQEQFLLSYYSKFILKSNVTGCSPWMTNICVWPFRFNSLFIFAFTNEYQKLKLALQGGIEIIADIYGVTPITISLERNTSRCLDEMLKHIVKLHQVADSKADVYLELASRDITKIIKTGSQYLPELLQIMFVAVDDSELPSFAVPRYTLPYSTLHPTAAVEKETFVVDNQQGEGILVEYRAAKFAWNFEPGSAKSLEFLKAVIESPNTAIYTTKIIKSIIQLKWNYLWNINFALTILYWISLATLVAIVYHDQNLLLNILFIVLNGFYLGYELFKVVALGSDYFEDVWNYLDLESSILCIIWSVLNIMRYTERYIEWVKYLEWVVALLCWIRGLTYFRTFTYTRYYVRMILEVAKDTTSFLIILMYSTFAFSVLYAIALDKDDRSFIRSIIYVYELDMGYFYNDNNDKLGWICFIFASIVNIILMMNLLISILGDAFNRVSEKADEADTMEMLHIIIELETLMVFKRNQGTPSYIQQVDALEEKVETKALEVEIQNVHRYMKLLDQSLANRILEVKDQIRLNKKELNDQLVELKKHTEEQRTKSDSKLDNIKTTVDQLNVSVNERLSNQMNQFEHKMNSINTEQQEFLNDLEKKILSGIAEKLFSGFGSKLGLSSSE